MRHVRKLRLRKIRYWRITVGTDTAQWAAWREGNFVALGWDELGDLTGLSRREFEQRRDLILTRFPERTKASADLVWLFARQLHEGDRIVVARNSQETLGVATVVGPYFFVPDVYRGHCLPVDWNDLTPRRAALPNWRRAVVELTFAQFDEVQAGEPLTTPASLTPPEPAAHRLQEAPVGYVTATPDPQATTVVPTVPNLSAMPGARQPLFPLEELAASVGQATATVASWVRAVERKGQIIFAGPPGVGKTFAAQALARHLVGGSDGFWEVVQFHPAYSYEDFVQGLRPLALSGGGLEYRLLPGRFLDFCRRAASRQGRCVLVIDEINRANLSTVFGELLYLLEYRNHALRLAGGEAPFAIPDNVRLIGTMNTADRSIALVDHALRRRFALVTLAPNYDLLVRFHTENETGFPVKALVKVLKRVNHLIGDEAYALGISYFLRADLAETMADIWQLEIEPYLAEYFFDQPDRAALYRWPQIRTELALPVDDESTHDHP
jgi:MoxR-like ATPase